LFLNVVDDVKLFGDLIFNNFLYDLLLILGVASNFLVGLVNDKKISNLIKITGQDLIDGI
jgi:hypothetical protein